mgnify:FL=1
MGVLFTFSDNTTITSEYMQDSLRITEKFHNDLKPADSTCSLTVPYTMALAAKLMAETGGEIKAVVTSPQGNTLFTGYLNTTLTFSKTQRTRPINLEIQSPSIRLKKPIPQSIYIDGNTTVSEIAEMIAELVGEEITANIPSQYKVHCFFAEEGEEAYSIITTLLFESGYIFNYDRNGDFYVLPLFPTATTSQSQPDFNDTTILNQIQIVKTDIQYGGASVTIQNYETRYHYGLNKLSPRNQCVYNESEGQEDGSYCSIDIQDGDRLYGEEWAVLDYASKNGEVVRADLKHIIIKIDDVSNSSAITSWSTAQDESGNDYYYKTVNGIQFKIYDNHTSATIQAANSTGSTKTLKRMSFYADVTTEAEVQNYTARHNENQLYEYTAKHLHSRKLLTGDYRSIPAHTDETAQNIIANITAKALAKSLSEKIADYYRYTNLKITFESKTAKVPGQTVTITSSEIGGFTAVITERIETRTGYSYTALPITEYTPAQATEPIPRRKMEVLDYVRGEIEEILTEDRYDCELTKTYRVISSSVSRGFTVNIYKNGSLVENETFYIKWRYETKTVQTTWEDAYWSDWQEGTVQSGGFVGSTSNPIYRRDYQIRIYSDSAYSDLLCTAGIHDGASETYWLDSSTTGVNRSTSGAYTPSSVTFTGKYKTCSQTADYPGRFIIEKSTDGTTYTEDYRSSSDESSITYTMTSGTKLVRATLYKSGGFTEILDSDIVKVLEDGNDGKDGGYQDYKFAVGAFDLTDAQQRALTWEETPPATTAQAPCLYMATKWIEGE